MRFDRFGSSAGESQTLLPDGIHEVEIAKVKEVIVKASGRAKTVVTFVATAGDYEPVEKWLDSHDRRDSVDAIKMLSALGLQADHDVDDRLAGRRLSIVTKSGKKKNGDTVVYINGFSSSESSFEQDDANNQQALRSSPARSQAAKAHKAFTDTATAPDDIPF